MFDWKLILTVIILLGIMAFFISTQAPVQDFFKSIKDKLYSFIGYMAVEEKNISFSLVAEYDNIQFKDDINITIYPIIFSANIRDMDIETSDTVGMDFSGSGIIVGKSLSLDGITDRVEIANSSMTFKRASVNANSTFTELIIDNLELEELKLRSGSLFIKGTETNFNSIDIYNLEGRFEFSDDLKIEGIASRISIPEADMVID